MDYRCEDCGDRMVYKSTHKTPGKAIKDGRDSRGKQKGAREMSKNAEVVDIFVDGDDYFALTKDDGSVQFGIKGDIALIIPEGHDVYEEVLACKTEKEVEQVFDQCVGAGMLNVYG